MSNTRDEIMIKFAEELAEYSESGASEWPRTKSDVEPEGGETAWEKPPELSDEEALKLIHEDPMHVATNLMLQQKPEYQKVKFIYPLLKGVIEWMSGAGMEEAPPIVHDEIKFMIGFLEDHLAQEEEGMGHYEEQADVESLRKDRELMQPQ